LVSALLLPLPQAASDSSVAAATPAAIARVVIFFSSMRKPPCIPSSDIQLLGKESLCC